MCTVHVLLMQSCKQCTSALFSVEKVIDTLIVLKMLASYLALVRLVQAVLCMLVSFSVLVR